MSYDTTRDSEQLRAIDPSIDDFIDRYNNSSGLADGSRQTVFLFPGGMASALRRATKPYVDGISSPQTFAYETVWLTHDNIVWGVPELRMTKVAPGKYRDKDDCIIVADGEVKYLGCTPYIGFTIWCNLKGLDYFVFGWDWRRRLEHSGKFFVKKFLPYFQDRVKTGCNNADPLASFSLVGHSAGGMVVNWLLRQSPNYPTLATMRLAITVSTPFYGYAGQVHRWFEGQSPFNGLLDSLKQETIKVICSCPACYTWMFLDEYTYNQNKVALAADPKYPLATYPSVDKSTGAVADPYNPQTNGNRSRYPAPSATGFDPDELAHARNLIRYLASSLDPELAAKFVNIRGDTTANDTIGSTTWDWVPPTDPSPIANGAGVPGDGTQPAWTARHVGLAGAFPGNVVTVTGANVEHMFTLNSPTTLGALAVALGI